MRDRRAVPLCEDTQAVTLVILTPDGNASEVQSEAVKRGSQSCHLITAALFTRPASEPVSLPHVTWDSNPDLG